MADGLASLSGLGWAVRTKDRNVDSETGQVEIVRYVVVENCGRMVSPMIVEGRTHGASRAWRRSASPRDYTLPTTSVLCDDTPSGEPDQDKGPLLD